MKIGFTGTRSGMSTEQKVAFVDLLKQLKVSQFSHGDCVGSDDEAATFAAAMRPKPHIICHPPDNDKQRAHNNQYDEIRGPKPYLVRNRDIVNENDVLISIPRTTLEQRRSGTWSTIRYAKKQGKPVYIIYPSGSIMCWEKT